MATTVAQHSVATFTSPVNGTTPIDANTVRGNDNTTRAAYNDHDADPGIHVQSSTLASRPVAGTAGRKWITDDSGVYTLWFDDGTNWHPVSSENVALTVLAGENLVKGDVVKVTGWNNGQDLPEVVKTTSAADTAFAVITATVSSGSMGYATNTGIVQDVNTAAYSVGTILYANGSGGFTSTKPTSGNYQPVAYVLRANASNGVYYVEFSTPRIVERSDNTASTVVLRDSNGDFSAGTITATAVNATTLDLTNLEVTNIKAKDGTQAIAIADTTGKLTISDGVLLSALTASQAVFTDGSKNLVSNAITGTGNVVMSASPTLTGTVTAATLNATTLGGTLSTAAQPNVTSVGTLSSLTVSGQISSTTTASPIISNLVAGTTSRYGTFSNTGGDFYFGIESSAGGSLLSGSAAYARIFGTSAAYPLEFFTNNVKRVVVDASGNLAVDTNTLYVDAVNNRVGVGTASPAGYKLDIVGDTTGVASGNTPALRLRHAGDGGVETRFENGTGPLARIVAGVTSAGAGTDDGTLVFATAANSVLADRMTLDSSGNLGLGVTPSAWASTSKVFQLGTIGFLENNNNTSQYIGRNGYRAAGGWTYSTTSPAQLFGMEADGAFKWFTAPSGTAGNAITFTQALTLNASGNVLQGTTTDGPFGRNFVMDGTTSTGISLRVGGTLRGFVYADGTDAYLGAGTGAIIFKPADTERARITSGGYFKASDAGTYVSSTGTYHEMRQSAADYTLYNSNTHASGPYGIYQRYTAASPNGTLNWFLICEDSTAIRANIRSNGGLANYQSNNVDLSDARTKTDITPAASMWSKIGALEIVTYKYTDQTHDDVNLGVIAQQVEAVEPVWVDADGMGETPADGVPLKTVYTKDITFAAIKALQEAMARIETLEQRVLALEA